MANEIDKLDPIPLSVVLDSGLEVQLESLKSRQFMKLLRIITHGALQNNVGNTFAGLMATDTQEEFVGHLLTVVLLSIPDAEDETILFVKSLCYPAGLIEHRKLNKQDTELNEALWAAQDAELENPSLNDLVTILEAVVRREAEDIQALGKRLASMWTLAQKTGQIEKTTSQSQKTSTSASSGASAGRSTSSRRSTAGRTNRSSTAHSVGSDSQSPQFESDSITPVGVGSNG